MTSSQQKIELNEATHVIALDYFSKKLISGTASGKIVVYYIEPQGPPKLVGSIFAHQGPIWGLEWAHPSFGSIFASCSYDGYIRVWQQQNETPEFVQIYEHNAGCSANVLHFGPLEYGLRFAVALANGHVCVIFRKESGHFDKESFIAHSGGCNAISWFPSIPPLASLAGSSNTSNSPAFLPIRMMTGGNDCNICIWRYNGKYWEHERNLMGEDASVKVLSNKTNMSVSDSRSATTHGHIVRDVCVLNNMNSSGVVLGLPGTKAVSCSEDKTVVIWTTLDPHLKDWIKQKIELDCIPYKVSFSETGNIIGITTSNNSVLLIKEAMDGSWSLLKEVNQDND